ncbi:EPIDERMAL PATTERNING FACTOR-like protein 8 [Camellia lanceoleosa]|uniref:EPIDERMAL PATTERNING FACTOR-like protein 8 n=1 Tax=Camellia lanceoleosa TaxID=1840588 RepID=A0ACC0I614_9ERIC|nr:EPIDERMAL PATTERNING FACTOR-like protein 8 [Camellia lanceoleosa]
MMALSAKNYPHGLKIAVTVILISSLSFLPSKSVGTMQLSSDSKSQQQRKMMLGSRPPVCENKCMSCRPCMATLVIPLPQDNKKSFKESSSSSHREDDYYYLSWKCKCGDKLYQP